MITQGKEPEIILRNGQPVAVILDIDSYQEILEKLEAIEDLEILAKIRQEKREFRSLDDFIKEYTPDV